MPANFNVCIVDITLSYRYMTLGMDDSFFEAGRKILDLGPLIMDGPCLNNQYMH